MTFKDMLGRSGVAAREDALKQILDHFPLPELPEEEVRIGSSLERILAEEIVSPVDLPSFNRSTVDGIAVRSADTFGASESHAALLMIIGDIPMGVLPDKDIAKGQGMKIATGGALPGSADAVVMFEQTQPLDEQSIEVIKSVGPYENVIQAGDDIRMGELMFSRGHKIRPQDMAALAAVGITRVRVFGKPRVAIISTGNEIVPAEAAAGPGQIRDSNSYNLEGLVIENGGMPVKKGIVRDDKQLLRTALQDSIQDCSLVLMTGGSSVGIADHTATVINEFGPPGVIIHGVSIKPGKPLIAGIVKRSGTSMSVPVFGLPGHPVAVTICFDIFVRPLLARFSGEVPNPALAGISHFRTVRATLARSISSVSGREDYIRVLLERNEKGLFARPVFGASGLVSTLIKAAGVVVVPSNTIGLEPGEEVEVRLF